MSSTCASPTSPVKCSSTCLQQQALNNILCFMHKRLCCINRFFAYKSSLRVRLDALRLYKKSFFLHILFPVLTVIREARGRCCVQAGGWPPLWNNINNSAFLAWMNLCVYILINVFVRPAVGVSCWGTKKHHSLSRVIQTCFLTSVGHRLQIKGAKRIHPYY